MAFAGKSRVVLKGVDPHTLAPLAYHTKNINKLLSPNKNRQKILKALHLEHQSGTLQYSYVICDIIKIQYEFARIEDVGSLATLKTMGLLSKHTPLCILRSSMQSPELDGRTSDFKSLTDIEIAGHSNTFLVVSEVPGTHVLRLHSEVLLNTNKIFKPEIYHKLVNSYTYRRLFRVPAEVIDPLVLLRPLDHENWLASDETDYPATGRPMTAEEYSFLADGIEKIILDLCFVRNGYQNRIHVVGDILDEINNSAARWRATDEVNVCLSTQDVDMVASQAPQAEAQQSRLPCAAPIARVRVPQV